MITIAFTKSGNGVVWGGFMDENGINHLMNEIGNFYPGIGTSDIEKAGRKRLRELEKDWGPQKDGEQFMIDFDGKI